MEYLILKPGTIIEVLPNTFNHDRYETRTTMMIESRNSDIPDYRLKPGDILQYFDSHEKEYRGFASHTYEFLHIQTGQIGFLFWKDLEEPFCYKIVEEF